MNALAIPTREQLEALPPEQFRELYSTLTSIRMLRIPRRASFRPGSAAALIAALAVGESHLFRHWESPNRLGHNVKHYARLRLNDAAANWSAHSTNQGVRVTRVA